MRAEITLGLACAALALGEALGFAWSSAHGASLFVLGVAVLVMLFGFAARWRAWPFVFLFVFGLGLALHVTARRQRVMDAIRLANAPYETVLTVKEAPHVTQAKTAGCCWVSFRGASAIGTIKVVYPSAETNALPRVGERWQCRGWFMGSAHRPAAESVLRVRGRGTFARHRTDLGVDARVQFLSRVRDNLSRRMGIGLENRPGVANLNRAMVLGERAGLPADLREAFVRSGTIHVFAISGLHVMVVAHFVMVVLCLLGFPARWALLPLMPILWLYVVLIGAPPSGVRAATMACIYYAAPLFYRRPNGLTAWAITMLAFALLAPATFFSVGSLLSFSVMLGILLFIRWAQPFSSPSLLRLGVPFAAWAAGVPIAARVFARITPGGLLANLVLVPLAGGAVLLGVVGLALSFISNTLAAHANNLAGLFTEAMTGVAWAVSRLPAADFQIAKWSLSTCLAWYAVIILSFILARLIRLRRHRMI